MFAKCCDGVRVLRLSAVDGLASLVPSMMWTKSPDTIPAAVKAVSAGVRYDPDGSHVCVEAPSSPLHSVCAVVYPRPLSLVLQYPTNAPNVSFTSDAVMLSPMYPT